MNEKTLMFGSLIVLILGLLSLVANGLFLSDAVWLYGFEVLFASIALAFTLRNKRRT